MSQKIKNVKTATEQLTQLSQQAGIVLMTAAVTLGMVEMPEHSSKVVIPNQPSFAVASSGGEHHPGNDMRREREEAGPHYTSYNVAQRTPSRTGKP